MTALYIMIYDVYIYSDIDTGIDIDNDIDIDLAMSGVHGLRLGVVMKILPYTSEAWHPISFLWYI